MGVSDKDKVFIDIETFSSIPIKYGVRKYTSSSDFHIQLCSWKMNSGTTCCDLTQTKLPEEFIKILADPNIAKIAHNAEFECTCFEKAGYIVKGPWYCTMIMAKYYGLPGGLDKIGEIINLDVQKMKDGKKLVDWFSKPTKAGKIHKPGNYLNKWAKYIEYNIQDVNTEEHLWYYLVSRNVFEMVEWELFELDRIICNRGLNIDKKLCQMIVNIDDKEKENALSKASEITGLDNPNSLPELKKWLIQELWNNPLSKHLLRSVCNYNIVKNSIKLDKDVIEQLLSSKEVAQYVKDVLQIRRETSNISVAKFTNFLDTEINGKIYNRLRFYGCHTGRWTSNIFNLPRTKLHDLEIVTYKSIIMDGINPEIIENDIFKNLIRTAIVAPEGQVLSVADYSAIECRVLCYLAGEDWANKVFAGDGLIYEAQASRMYNVKIDKVTSDLRDKGKKATLALGYGGAVGALKAMKWEGTEEEGVAITKLYRKSNPNIVAWWHILYKAAKEAVEQNNCAYVQGPDKKGIIFNKMYTEDVLRVMIPSGRVLCYQSPRIDENGNLYYYGWDSQTRKWTKLSLWHGLLAENIVQATARDCLVDAITELEFYNFNVVFHVYDEIICEGEPCLDEMLEIMEDKILWAPGLKLKATGYCSPFYKKE